MIPVTATSSHSVQSGTEAIGFMSRQSPYIWAYPISTSGAGTKSANPASIPSTSGQGGVAFSQPRFNNETLQPTIFTATSSTPYTNMYPYSTLSGTIGTRYTDPGVLLTGAANFVAVRITGFNSGIASYSTAATPYAHLYNYNDLGWRTKSANPATLPTGQSWTNAMTENYNQNWSDVAFAHDTSPFVTVYGLTLNILTGNHSLGTKRADPSPLPTANSGGGAVAFNSVGKISDGTVTSDTIALGTSTAPRLNVYAYTRGTGFGSKATDPATGPTGQVWSVAFSRGNTHIGTVHNTSPFLSVYPWTSGSPGSIGTKLADPASPPGAAQYGIVFTDEFLIISGSPTNAGEAATRIYRWDGSSIGTLLTSPGSGPTDNTYEVTYRPISKIGV